MTVCVLMFVMALLLLGSLLWALMHDTHCPNPFDADDGRPQELEELDAMSGRGPCRSEDPWIIQIRLGIEERNLIQQCFYAEFPPGNDYPDIKLQAFFEMVRDASADDLIPVYRAQLRTVREFARTHRLPWLIELLQPVSSGKPTPPSIPQLGDPYP